MVVHPWNLRVSVGLSISKWIRECQPWCAHFFDIWHIARSIGKAMIKLSKEKGVSSQIAVD